MSPSVYSLTALTGRKKNAGRTLIIQGFEVGRRGLIITGLAIAASLIPTFILYGFAGPYAVVFVPPAFIAAAFYFIESRSRKGLQLRMYETIRDKKRADTTTFFICWRPVDEGLGEHTIVASAAPTQRDTARRIEPIYTPAHPLTPRKRTR